MISISGKGLLDEVSRLVKGNQAGIDERVVEVELILTSAMVTLVVGLLLKYEGRYEL